MSSHSLRISEVTACPPPLLSRGFHRPRPVIPSWATSGTRPRRCWSGRGGWASARWKGKEMLVPLDVCLVDWCGPSATSAWTTARKWG